MKTKINDLRSKLKVVSLSKICVKIDGLVSIDGMLSIQRIDRKSTRLNSSHSDSSRMPSSA